MSEDELRQRDDRAAGEIPLRRVGRLREVGLMAAYLASDAARYVTGQSFYIDGGLTWFRPSLVRTTVLLGPAIC